MIPYGHHQITEADIDAVVAILRSDCLTQGPTVPRFECAVAACCGARHAIAVNSATSALHLACLGLGLGPDDVLWTVPNTFVASANCARYCGAGVDFVDIDADTWNMDVHALRAKLVAARRDGQLPTVVVPVHFGGQPTDQEEIWDLARQFGFKVLEDASHSIGASRNGERVGSCRWSDAVVFSFHPVKTITTGEGGMVMTNDEELAWRVATLRSHGITRDAVRMQCPPEGPWHYEQLELGYNYRMTDLAAALGLSQLERLDERGACRNALARRYDGLLSALPVALPSIRRGNTSAFHLYVIRLRPNAAQRTQRDVFEALRHRDIGTTLHYRPVHLQPYYRKLGFTPGMYSQAEAYAREAITLPLYPALTESDQDTVVEAVREALA